MKGLNLKKVGALVAGTAILASSVAFAGPLFFGDTALVNDNGQPLVKVVVGEKASASDGVAAANIASRLANEAWGKETWTAVSSGGVCGVPQTETGNTSEESSGSSDCTVTSETVTLEITSPGGVAPGVQKLELLLNDRADRDPLDRNDTGSDDTFALSNSETGTTAHPFTDGAGSSASTVSSAGTTETALYRFDLGEKSISDPKDSSVSYTESESLFVDGWTEFDTGENEFGFKLNSLTYVAKFDSSSNDGILVCTKTNDTTNKDYTSCKSDSDATKNHRLMINFLGEEWTIVDMSPPSSGLPSSDTKKVVSGGSIKLAKESKRKVLQKGDELLSGDGAIKLVLQSVSQAATTEAPPASFEVYDAATGEQLPGEDGLLKVSSGTSKSITYNGKTYTIRVYDTLAGADLQNLWADTAFTEKEFELNDNSKLDDENNDKWTVSLMWKNKDQSSDTATGHPDNLRAIALYRDDFTFPTTDDNTLMEGESAPLIDDPTHWTLKYAGLDFSGDDFDSLSFKVKEKTFSGGFEGNDNCKFSNVPVVEVSGSNLETVGGESIEAFYVVLYNTTNSSDCSSVSGLVGGENLTKGTMVYKTSGDKWAVDATNNYVRYFNAGEQGTLTSGGVIGFANNSSILDNALTGIDISGVTSVDGFIDETTNDNHMLFAVVEDAGKLNSQERALDAFVFGVTNKSSTNLDKSSTYEFKGLWNSDENAVWYKSIGEMIDGSEREPTTTTYDEGELISERGSKFTDKAASSVSFNIAKHVGHALVYLSEQSSSTTTDASTSTVTLAEGEETTVGDYTIKVASIDEQFSCQAGAGATPQCALVQEPTATLVDSEGNAHGESVEVTKVVPVSDLVVLDSSSDAQNTGLKVSVGGPNANDVTKTALEGSDAELTQDSPVLVKKVGDVIVVAGWTAEDTLTATQEFLDQLTTTAGGQ